jgi:hypothetical protein
MRREEVEAALAKFETIKTPFGMYGAEHDAIVAVVRAWLEPNYEAAAALYLDDDMHGDLDLILTITKKIVDAALQETQP